MLLLPNYRLGRLKALTPHAWDVLTMPGREPHSALVHECLGMLLGAWHTVSCCTVSSAHYISF